MDSLDDAVYSPPPMERRAKIVATIGPSSSSPSVVKRLLAAGADVVRINLSHGDETQHREIFAAVRAAAEAADRHVPIIMDLMGPRYRLGTLAADLRLKKGERVWVGARSGSEVDGPMLPIDEPRLLRHLAPGERLLIADGLVELKVRSKRRGRIEATVVNGGPVSSRKGINLPDSDLPFSISAKDRSDMALAVELGADYLAASYVGTARDLAAIRKVVADAGPGADGKQVTIPIVAKLERARAIDHLDDIVTHADAVMVARGDLGVEVPLHRVPVLQKQIIESGRLHGKPVIVATQMLESMIEQPRPTRAESSDVANAVFDGADALMLSGETAAGRHPVEAVRTMARIIVEAEAHGIGARRAGEIKPLARAGDLAVINKRDRRAGNQFVLADVVSAAAVFSTRHVGVRQIVAFSQGGFTARMIARYRPRTPICVLTRTPAVARRIQLIWGIRPMLIGESGAGAVQHDEIVEVVDRMLLEARLAKANDIIVLLMGVPMAEKPLTNLMRLHRVRRRPGS